MTANVLVITPSLANIEILRNQLSKQHYQVLIASNNQETLNLITTNDLDIILLDFDMLPLITDIQSFIKNSNIPIILVSTENQSDESTRVMDLLNKIDSLTDAHTRSHFNSKIIKLYNEAIKNGTDLSLIIMDMDFFKEINDTKGHLAGDEMLKKVTQIIKSSTRRTDLISRFGGEEFALLFPGENAHHTRIIAERIRRIIKNDLATTASFGITSLTQSDSIEDFINRADQALYSAKKTGRNKIVIH